MPNEKTKVRVLGVPVSGSFVALLAVVGGLLLVWLAKETWSSVEQLNQTTQQIQSKIEKLESDEAKWAAMADMRNDITKLHIDFEVLKRVFESEFDRHVPLVGQEHQDKIKIDKQDLEALLKERELEAEEFRRTQQILAPRSKK